MKTTAAALGKVYHDGELVLREGELGDCMFVVESGEAEIFREVDGTAVTLRIAGPSDIFGEMALIEHDVRSASVRARGEARILRVDKQTFLRRIHEDPSLAFRVMESLAHEIRRLAREVAELKARTAP